MSKTFVLFIGLMILPTVVMADACVAPSEFTIDRRCYVNDAQKITRPFNSAVALMRSHQITCTGTIIAKDNKLYLYTAKHCTYENNSGNPDKSLRIKLQDGREFDAEYVTSGNYAAQNSANSNGDWAVYAINQNVSSVSHTGLSHRINGDIDVEPNAMTLGYGALKIMSDNEIKDFMQKYVAYLRSSLRKKDKKSMSADDESVFMYGKYGKGFIEHLALTDPNYYDSVFGDISRLKVSYCKYYYAGTAAGCQTWFGNSGGGIFDSDGNLLGIVASSPLFIIGEEYAGKMMIRAPAVAF